MGVLTPAYAKKIYLTLKLYKVSRVITWFMYQWHNMYTNWCFIYLSTFRLQLDILWMLFDIIFMLLDNNIWTVLSETCYRVNCWNKIRLLNYDKILSIFKENEDLFFPTHMKYFRTSLSFFLKFNPRIFLCFEKTQKLCCII